MRRRAYFSKPVARSKPRLGIAQHMAELKFSMAHSVIIAARLVREGTLAADDYRTGPHTMLTSYAPAYQRRAAKRLVEEGYATVKSGSLDAAENVMLVAGPAYQAVEVK